MPVGYQDPWVAGSLLLFRRDPVDSVTQPMIDMGTIQVLNPSFEVENIRLEDARTGKKSLVDETNVKLEEAYDITCSNLSQHNLALLMLGSLPEAWTQASSETDGLQYAHPGHLIQIEDSSGEPLFRFADIAGVCPAAANEFTVTDVTVATKTITVSENASALQAGDLIILSGTGDVSQAGTYTVVSSSGTGPTDIVVSETIPGSDTAQGTVYDSAYEEAVDWEEENLDLGLIRMIDGGAFTTAANVRVVGVLAAVTDAEAMRTFNPNRVVDIKGDALLVWNRKENAQTSVRKCRISLVPASSNIQTDDYSNFVLRATVLETENVAGDFGYMRYIKGSNPAKS